MSEQNVTATSSHVSRPSRWIRSVASAGGLSVAFAVLLGMLGGVGVFTFGYGQGASYLSNNPQSCINCHVMQGHFDSWQNSSHRQVAVCNDCHLPHHSLGKWVTKADNGFFHSLAFTLENFHEPIQIKARNRRVTQETCLHCHRELVHHMLPAETSAGMLSCIHCHPDVGHGAQGDVALVVLKTHLVALRPRISQAPFCVVDAEGFHHIPHRPSSVFGTNRWLHVRHGEDEEIVRGEIQRIWHYHDRFFPAIGRGSHAATEWVGNTVQPMHVLHIEANHTPQPIVVDHERELPRVRNLLSVFPGRATLWPHLAERAQQVILQKLQSAHKQVAAPPWGSCDG